MTRRGTARTRLLIVEEALKDHRGHWFSYARRVAEFNEAEGVEVEVAAHAEVDRDLEWSVPVHPLFRTSYWDGAYPARRKVVKQLGYLLRANWRFYRELSAHLARSDRYDLAFAPSTIVHQLIGWLALLRRFGGSKLGCAVLLIRMGPQEPHAIEGSPISDWNARFMGWWLRRFRRLHQLGRVRFATDSEPLARVYRHLCGMDFSVMPSPMHLAPAEQEREPQAGGPLRFHALGSAHYIKGTDVLLEAIRLLRSDPPEIPVRFVIQWPIEEVHAHGHAPLRPDEELAASGWVEYVRGELSAEDYGALLRSSDGILLPYRVDPYRERTSGVLIEAVTAGVPVIVTADTTLEAGLRACGTGLIAADGDPRDLAARIRELAADAESYRARARKGAADARRFHSSQRFQDLLWARSDASEAGGPEG